MATVRTRDQRRPGGDGGPDEEAASRALGLGTGWTVFSYLISGMVAYGAIGWVLGRAVHVSLLFPIGMVVGLGISVGWIIYRYGGSGGAIYGHGDKRGDDR